MVQDAGEDTDEDVERVETVFHIGEDETLREPHRISKEIPPR